MKKLARDVVIIAAATAASRLFGLFRDVVIADRFGAGAAYDAYLVAFFIPHFLRRLLAEGALALAFIPIYTEYLENDQREANRLASNALTLLLLLFPAVIIVGIMLAPSYIPFLASGFPPSQQQLTIQLTRVIFPFIGFIGLAALVMGILNAHRHFFAPAFAPVFFNLGVISGALFLGAHFSRPVFGLATGVLIGGLGQLLFQVPFLRRFDFTPSFRLFPIHPGLKRAFHLMVPVIVGLIAAQVNVMVDNKLASYLAEGSISSLQYAMRLFQLPLGLFAVAISTAILPRLSGKWAQGQEKEFSETFRSGLTIALFIIIPAALGLWLLGEPIVKLLFEHRSFTARDTARTVYVLNLYLIGLVGYSLVHLFTRAFYSLQKTMIPVAAGISAVAVNVGLDLLLIEPMGVGGLALATAVSGLVNGVILFVAFGRQVAQGDYLPRVPDLGKIVLSTALMGGVVWGVKAGVGRLGWGEFALVLCPISAGIAAYFCCSYFLGLEGLWKKAVKGAG
ncbi:MAG: murein biosynthesis integral membrane protein MurJ [Candidatus Acetothermia bacterium]